MTCVAGIPQADVPVSVENRFVREDAVRDDELVDERLAI